VTAEEEFMNMHKTVVAFCIALLVAQNLISQQMRTVKVPASAPVMAAIGAFDSSIWFFTSSDNPITTLDGLKKEEVSCWGAELIANVFSFLDAAGVKYEDKGLRIIGTGNGIYNGRPNPPKLFITWSKYSNDLTGAARVMFVDKASVSTTANPSTTEAPDSALKNNFLLRYVDDIGKGNGISGKELWLGYYDKITQKWITAMKISDNQGYGQFAVPMNEKNQSALFAMGRSKDDLDAKIEKVQGRNIYGYSFVPDSGEDHLELWIDDTNISNKIGAITVHIWQP
jgi:hypothetical protein